MIAPMSNMAMTAPTIGPVTDSEIAAFSCCEVFLQNKKTGLKLLQKLWQIKNLLVFVWLNCIFYSFTGYNGSQVFCNCECYGGALANFGCKKNLAWKGNLNAKNYCFLCKYFSRRVDWETRIVTFADDFKSSTVLVDGWVWYLT